MEPGGGPLRLSHVSRDSGIYTRKQLLAHGYDLADIRKGVADGELTRLRDGWFAIRTHDADVATAVKAGGALSCVSALRWHGLWVPPGYAETHLRRTRRKSGRGTSCSAIGGAAQGSRAGGLDHAGAGVRGAVHVGRGLGRHV